MNGKSETAPARPGRRSAPLGAGTLVLGASAVPRATVLVNRTALVLVVGTLAATLGTAVPATAATNPCTATVCSFAVPPGTYEITVSLGSKSAAANTGLDVEAHRTVLAPVATTAGQLTQRSVTVNVRTPESMPDGQEGQGTAGLQVHLTGKAPALAAIQVTPRPHTPQLFVISDSTASDWLKGAKHGWGQEFPQYFRDGLSVANYADSGSSTVSWLADSRLFATVQKLIQPGDEVLIQLAHNDKTTSEPTYQANLQKLVAGVRGRGGMPVLVTPPVRHLFNSDGTLTPTGLIVNNLGVNLPAVMRQVAASDRVPLLDLTADSAALLEKLGPTASWPLYLGTQVTPTDSAHFTPYGATVMSGLVVKELTTAHLPAAAFLRGPGN